MRGRGFDSLTYNAQSDSEGEFEYNYDVMCPNAILGCSVVCKRADISHHLAECPFSGPFDFDQSKRKEWEEREAGE